MVLRLVLRNLVDPSPPGREDLGHHTSSVSVIQAPTRRVLIQANPMSASELR